jgi:hypothetical protein
MSMLPPVFVHLVFYPLLSSRLSVFLPSPLLAAAPPSLPPPPLCLSRGSPHRTGTDTLALHSKARRHRHSLIDSPGAFFVSPPVKILHLIMSCSVCCLPIMFV